MPPMLCLLKSMATVAKSVSSILGTVQQCHLTPARSNNGLHNDTGPDNEHYALHPVTPTDSHSTLPFPLFFPPLCKAFPATQCAVYATHGITNPEDTPNALLHAAHTPLLSTMRLASPNATPLLNPNAFHNKLASILGAYRVLDTALLNSAAWHSYHHARTCALHAAPCHRPCTSACP
jgi:hypothetical protein